MNFLWHQMDCSHNKVCFVPRLFYHLAECVQKTNSEISVEIHLSIGIPVIVYCFLSSQPLRLFE
jgi:hypothetical protein